MIMVFEATLSNSREINEIYEKAMKELDDWYGIGWIDNTPRLFVVNDKESFMALAGKIRQDWVRGFGDYCDNIFVYSPEALEKYTTYKYEKDDYYRFIKHELDHRFFYTHTNNLRYPKWLVEGNAVCVSGQIKHADPVDEFNEFLGWGKSNEGTAYIESGYAVRLLIEKVGEKAFLSFLSGLSEKDFENEFRSVFQMELTYGDFNLLL